MPHDDLPDGIEHHGDDLVAHATPASVGVVAPRLAAVATAHGVARAELWVHGAGPADDAVASAAGFTAYRDLWQMRCPLPAEPSTVAVRAFTDADAGAFLDVNNRAFSWHPEQGGMTLDDLAARRAEPWFDPAGFLLWEDEGRVAGFCWTKVHPATDTDPALGEIYAIAVDPDAHGRGIGGPLTRAGLDHLASRGLEVGMLYVESDNRPAVVVYERIGFRLHHVDRAYERYAGDGGNDATTEQRP